ncbi:unnamed protein product [Brassicogethes aeneus]|uniref:beta-N-acetylhexosaminidase n=1 Tax=Brassicogethes aeneus TaxID=1431903 RepID=A0A9P0FG43_BRAAE|nr:unnamed protein product [Brassicogethes aeneus]
MNNYLQRIGFTVWRRKTTIIVLGGILAFLIFGVNFIRVPEKDDYMKEERDAQVIADALLRSINVKFVETVNRFKGNSAQPTESTNMDQNKEDLTVKNQVESLEIEQQLGIPFVNLDSKRPYVPSKRIVHFDLKGAPPRISYLKRLFPLIKTMGATGILMEYEDMFPFSGFLKNITAKNAYTVEQIKEILDLAEESKLDVIPLIQTFGHVEFVLKHPEFSNIREVVGSPQALCPSRNSSLNFIKELVTQVMVLHPNSKYLHIGCDEVFQMGECDVCRLELHETLFLRHVRKVANIVHEKYPEVRVIIWDDMLRHLSQQTMIDMNLGKLVEPMVWVYAEDIYRFVQPPVWDKYAVVFKTAWTASAFKGAFGETMYIPNTKRHLENNLRWLDVMSQQSSVFKQGMAGIVLTGWQRYDHFAVLCELLPAAVPSLAINLIAVSKGYFNSSLKDQFLSALSCPIQNNLRNSPFISLDSDPFMWEKLSKCMFPGSPFFRLTYRLHSTEKETNEYLHLTKKQKGWMTDYNIRHNYSLPLRVEELTNELPRVYHGMISLARSAADAMLDIFDGYTISEWIEQHIYPYIIELETIQNQSLALKSVNQWPSRPLPPLKDFKRLGIPLSVN